MYYVKVEGKTLNDLKAGLERHLSELSCYGEKTSVDVKVKKLAIEEEHTTEEIESLGDDMIEVESPFANVAPSLNLPAARSMVVDNELDSDGIPWDARIHSSSKAKVKKGTWKIARGVSDEQAFPILQELKARVGSAVVHAVAPVIVESPVLVTPVQAAPVVAPAMPQMNNGHTVDSFKANFALIIAQLITEGKINQEYINQLKAYFQIAEIWMATAEHQAMCFDTFVQAGIIQKVG